ncbi:hypothetical protein Salat_0282800 [Sesamum alatum]|uniref:Uncharacterized protein n=1 Tax=Sesamum alatum TaxID=300844 RepID=A0AAE1Z068_9LAMI|nr:hypothetical protein Salat_0282800 [Sesamum alatum]
MASNVAVGGGGGGSSDEVPTLRGHDQDLYNQWENYSSSGGGVSEIEEEPSGGEFDQKDGGIHHPIPLESIREEVEGSVFSFGGGGDDVVYVALGRQSEETSMDALIWALNNEVDPSSTVVFLIHVFPETKYIPSPLGKLPISQVNAEQRENYLAQERGKTREFLQKFLTVCSASSQKQVKVETILIESDMEAKAILDLIPILNIRKLVVGSTKSNLRKMRSRRGGSGVADQILQNAPEFCDVKIVCEGKEISDLPLDSPSTSLSPRSTSTDHRPPKFPQDQQPNNASSCGCFKL